MCDSSPRGCLTCCRGSEEILAFTEQCNAVEKLAQDLDPLSISVNTALDTLYYLQHDYDKALAQCRKALEIRPDAGTVHYDLFDIYSAKSMRDQAIDELEQGIRLEGRPEEAASIDQSYKQNGYAGALRRAIEIASNTSVEDYDP